MPLTYYFGILRGLLNVRCGFLRNHRLMFSCTLLHPTRVAMLTEGSTDAEKAVAGQHWMHSIELLKKGAIIFGGRTVDTTADSHAIVVIRANSEEEARKIMESDPGVKGGLFRARLFRYQPMLIGEWP